MNTLSYNKNNKIYNTNNYINKLKTQEPWVLRKDPRDLGPDARPKRNGSWLGPISSGFWRRTQQHWVLIQDPRLRRPKRVFKPAHGGLQPWAPPVQPQRHVSSDPLASLALAPRAAPYLLAWVFSHTCGFGPSA